MGWLRLVASNQAKDILKRETKTVPLDSNAGDFRKSLRAPHTDPGMKDLAGRIREIIVSLPNLLCRKVLILRLLREYNNKEIAVLLRYGPGGNVKIGNIYRECRLALIQRLAQAGISPESLKD